MAEFDLLDNREAFNKLDRSGMLSVVEQMPEMLSRAVKFSSGVILPKLGEVSQVIVLGMGGSAIAGDIAADLFREKLKAPILTNRGYSLPEFVGEKTLLFAISYSGDTEEVLSAVKEAEKKGGQIICVTSGGKLKEIATQKKYPLFLIPGGYQPRAALPYLLVPLVMGLEKMGLVNSVEEQLGEAIPFLEKLRDEYGFSKPSRVNVVKQLAKKLAGKTPMVFGSLGTTGAAALRLKTQLNENSKATAVLSVFPELCHNEIVNVSLLKRQENNFAWVLFRDEGDSERIKKRIEIVKSLLGRQLGGANEIVSQGGSFLSRILSLIFFGDYLSVYLAILRGIDPTPVEIISRLKKELQR